MVHWDCVHICTINMQAVQRHDTNNMIPVHQMYGDPHLCHVQKRRKSRGTKRVYLCLFQLFPDVSLYTHNLWKDRVTHLSQIVVSQCSSVL